VAAAPNTAAACTQKYGHKNTKTTKWFSISQLHYSLHIFTSLLQLAMVV
jgi:hypothetical protein